MALERHCYVGNVTIISLAQDRLLIKIAHMVLFLKPGPALHRQFKQHGELLGTDFVANHCQHCRMKSKGKTPIKPVRTTVASVNKEMQKPRLTESVRNDGKRLAIPEAKRPTSRPRLIPSMDPQK
jgi:hypothetical protein